MAHTGAAKQSAQGRVAVVGMFDGVHTGHRHLFDQLAGAARDHGLEPLVITFSNHPLDLVAPRRAPRLLLSPGEKLRELVAATGAKVIMLPFDEALRHTTTREFLETLHQRHAVTMMLLGFNNRFGHDAPDDFDTYRRLGRETGVEILQADEKPGASSSEIRSLLAHGDAEAASRLLGRPYFITGHVERGRQIGRTIGFPTANLVPDDPRRLVPANGVYACLAHIPALSNKWHPDCREPHRPVFFPAMVNIGRRPTIADGLPPTIEAHIIGLENTDLYGQEITLEFIARLRQEQRFDSLEALRAQLAADRETVLRLLAANGTTPGMP